MPEILKVMFNCCFVGYSCILSYIILRIKDRSDYSVDSSTAIIDQEVANSA